MTKKLVRKILLVAMVVTVVAQLNAQDRARDLGVPFLGTPGPNNAITDVAGVEVGHTTLIQGEGKLERGKGPVRTGVTAIHPRGKNSTHPVFGSWFTLNAAGEMTGTTWLEERGLIDGPIMITNTHSVGVVRDAAVEWMVNKGWPASWHVPITAETYDGELNDINGFHVTKMHALAAMSSARSGPVQEGAVGGGTGMICNQFKGGIGTSSRVVKVDDKSYTVGVLVQCNYGSREDLKQIASVPVRELVNAPYPCYKDETLRPAAAQDTPLCSEKAPKKHGEDGSIIIVVATDVPLLPHQLKRLAKRPSLGLGWLGAVSNDGSGDIFVAFSTAPERGLSENETTMGIEMYPNNQLSIIFEAAIQATEEAIVNAMVAADTMTGVDSFTVHGLPEAVLRDIMKKHARH